MNLSRRIVELSAKGKIRNSYGLLKLLLFARWPSLILATILFTIAALLHMVIPAILAKIIDEGLVTGDSNALMYWGALLAGVSLLNPLSYVAGFRVMSLIEADARRDLNLAINTTVSHGTTHEGPHVSMGETINVVTTDNATLGSVFSTVGHGAMNLTAFGTGVILVWNIHPALGLTIAVGVLATTLVAGPLLQRLENRAETYRASLSDTVRGASDIVRGIRVLRGLGGEQNAERRYRKQSRSLMTDSYAVAEYSSWVVALQITVPLCFITTVLWLGARLAQEGEISVGQLGAAFGFATGLVMYSGSLLGNAQAIVGIRVALRRISEFLLCSSHSSTQIGPIPSDLDLPIESGLLTVVVAQEMEPLKRTFESATFGRSGKHTLMVSDDDYIFSGTLAENLIVEPDQVDSALAAVGGQDIIDSISTQHGIEDRGMNLSGGQRQRLVLARAIARDPDRLLLCDPTSAVDAATEYSIVKKICELREGKTTVVASPSLIWRRNADRIVYHDIFESPVGNLPQSRKNGWKE